MPGLLSLARDVGYPQLSWGRQVPRRCRPPRLVSVGTVSRFPLSHWRPRPEAFHAVAGAPTACRPLQPNATLGLRGDLPQALRYVNADACPPASPRRRDRGPALSARSERRCRTRQALVRALAGP